MFYKCPKIDPKMLQIRLCIWIIVYPIVYPNKKSLISIVDVSFHTGSTHGNFVVRCSMFSVQGHLIYILHPQFGAQLMKSMRWTDVVDCEAFDSLKDQKGA